MKHGVLLILLASALSGCATRYCERNEQVYESAVEKAPLQSPEGLQVPEPDPNYAIPEATGENVKYATPGVDAKGRARTNCLDTPPALIVTAPPAELEPADGYADDFETEAAPDAEDETVVQPEAEPAEF